MTDTHRFPASLFSGERNLSLSQRALYIGAGLGLAALAARPRPNPVLSVLALAGGAMLAFAGQQGHCPVKAALVDGSEDHDDRRMSGHLAHDRGERRPLPL